MDLKTVTFFLTDKCNAACDVCCFKCNPQNDFVMDMDVIKRYIDEAADMGTVELICFTGGECMLYPELIKEAASYAKTRYGLPSSLVSNGFWAADFGRGSELMQELKEAGLSTVRISADNYHQEFVPVSSVKNAISILAELGMLSEVTIMDTKSRANIKSMLARLRPEIYFAPKVTYYTLHLPGIVKDKMPCEELEMPVMWDAAYCMDSGSVQLYTDGYMYNCCSQFSFEIPHMRVGKIGETTLAQALNKINRDPILDLLRRDSVTWFARKAKESGYPVRERYTTSCELCRDILCNEELMAKLYPLAEEEVRRLRMERFMSI